MQRSARGRGSRAGTDRDFTTSPFSARGIARRERERGLGHRLDRLAPLGRQVHHRGRAFGGDGHLGRDRVDRDAVAAELGRQRLGEPVERRLARRVRGRARELPGALGPGGAESAMTVAMLTIQPAPRSRIAGTAALASRYGVIALTSYATRSRRSEVSSIER